MIKFKNVIGALKSQLPIKRAFKEFFITKNAWGLFSINSHINQTTQKPKMEYPTKEIAWKAAKSLENKTGNKFSAYKCMFCDSWHIGKDKN